MFVAALLLALPCQVHLQGTVTADGGDYLLLPFEVPAGTVEFQIAHSDLSDENILDWGLWGPEGWRGWGGGLTDDIVVGVEESSRGYMPGPITPGTWNLVVGKAKIVTSPAQYLVDVSFRGSRTIPVRFRVDAGEPSMPGAQWYAGDLHVHSSESGDASATLGEIVRLAQTRHLQFVAVSDHNTISHHSLLGREQHFLTPGNRDNLLLMRSAEVTTYKGHGGALGANAYVDHRLGLDGRDAHQVISDVHDHGGIFIINHPALDLGNACIGCAWQGDDATWMAADAVEIHTGAYQPVATLFTPLALQAWDEKLNAGAHLTAVGGSDDHTAGTDTGQFASPIGSPTTRVFATSLSEAGIMEGIRNGRVVVALRGPDDPTLELFAVADNRETVMVGDHIAANRVELRAHAVGAQGLRFGLFRNGRLEDTRPVTARDIVEAWGFSTSSNGDRWRVHLLDGDLDVVVTNHIYVAWGEPVVVKDKSCLCVAPVGSGVPVTLAWLLLVVWRAVRPAGRPRSPRA